MRLKIFLRPAVVLAGAGLCLPLAAQEADLESQDGRAGYSIGVNIGMNLQSQGIAENVNVDSLLAGLADGLSGDLQLSQQEIATALQELTGRLESQSQQDAEANAQAQEEFLEDNAQREEVSSTESGLQYMVLEEGDNADAPSPSAQDTVNVHYHGELIDGTVFDSSVERGEPVTFQLDGVIPGWTEGLQLMQVGDKYRFFIPSELAYGESGAGQQIGPNQTLIFDVELLGIEEQGGQQQQ